jgi:hypothetical protein
MSSNVTLSSENRPPWRTKYLDPINVARANAEKLSENSLKILLWVSVNVDRIGARVQNPNLPLVVLGFAFSLKAVDLVHVICLVISSVQEEVVGS